MTTFLRRTLQPSLLRPSIRTVRLYSTSKPSRTFDPVIAPGSENHYDLPSFLAYAERVSLSPDRTVYIGTHYEYTVAATLKRLGFELTRTGRASDFGIDLLGTWTLPVPDDASPRPLPLRVLIQCKASNKILNPKHVRELEGAFTGAPAQWREEDFLGLLATTKKATKGVMEALGRSRWPMGFLKVDTDGRVEQFLWNSSARARGLESLGVTLRYMTGEKNADGETRSDIALTWQGRPLPYVELKGEAAALPALQIQPVEAREQSENAPVVEEEKPVKKRGRPRKKKDEDAA